jgi:hypothetical protein
LLKNDELANPHSCLNRALPVEMLFVLLARDTCAPEAIRFWCQCRVYKGKNKADDPQIVEAMDVARRMEDQQRVLKEEVRRAKEQTVTST